MGSVERLPSTDRTYPANNQWTDILHTMGRRVLLLLHLAVCVHRYHGKYLTYDIFRQMSCTILWKRKIFL